MTMPYLALTWSGDFWGPTSLRLFQTPAAAFAHLRRHYPGLDDRHQACVRLPEDLDEVAPEPFLRRDRWERDEGPGGDGSRRPDRRSRAVPD
jgi:hypothetical protein